MVIKMSDYLLEQEISTASCNDILLEQAAAEIEVSSALIDAYCKQAVMLEYAYMEETESESEEKSEKKPGIFKKMGEAIKKFFSGIFSFLRGLWDKVVGFFRHTKVDHMVKKLDDMTPEEKAEFSGAIAPALKEGKGSSELRKRLFGDIAELTKRFVELFEAVNTDLNTWTALASDSEKLSEKIAAFREMREGMLKSNDMSTSRINQNNWAEYRAWLLDVKKVCDDTTITDILKTLNKKEITDKFAEALGLTGEKGEDRSNFDALIKCIKATGNTVTRESGKAVNDIMKMVEAGRDAMVKRRKDQAAEAKKLEREAKKAAKKAAGEEESEED